MNDDAIDLEAELDRLYALPASELVAERNALSKRLRLAGDRDTAARVKKLARPSVTAWAVNQLAFRAAAELEGLRSAGEKVRAAHLAGPKEQQAAASARRDAIAALRVIAEVALQEVGVAPNRGHRKRISQTLEVLSSQGAEAGAPRAGRLSTDLEPAGFDALGGDLAAALAASAATRPPTRPEPATPKAAKPKPAASKRSRPKVVEHPSSKPRKDPVARQAAARLAAERRLLDSRKQRGQTRLEELEEKVADLVADAESATAAFEEAKREEATLMTAAREAERLAVEARTRVKSAAKVTAQFRRDAESAAAARRRVEAEIDKERQKLERIDSSRDRLED